MNDICELLETYSGRDKVVRLACYILKLWGSASRNQAVLAASNKMSHTRMTLRLFDDIPMLKHTLNYGLGRHERDWTSALLGVVGNVVDQLFFPIEKVCWLSEIGILKLSKERARDFDTTNTVFWVLSLYINLLKTLKSLHEMNAQQECLQSASEGQELQRKLEIKYWLEAVTVFKLCLDVTHAVNCLPDGWLWGGRFDGVKVGLIASTSSLMGIGIYFAKKRCLK